MARFRVPRARFEEPVSGNRAGQALVETALILPLILILLLGAVDFGRLFFGWVNLHQTARIVANFAATHPGMTAVDYDDAVALVQSDAAALNCNPSLDGDQDYDEQDFGMKPPSFSTPAGTPTATPTLGDYATFSLECDFSMLTPLATVFFGEIAMEASATFPVREGCINCPTPPPAPPPPTPAQCRLVPQMEGMSVAGARLAWESAGFIGDNFHLASGEPTSTVADAAVTQDPLSTCVLPNAIFSSDVAVSVEPPDDPSCLIAPNVTGMPLDDAQSAWSADFVGPFTADGVDPDTLDGTRRVVSQTTTPEAEPGVECLDPGASIAVTTGDPWPAAPPQPCEVPSMVGDTRKQAHSEWVDAGFVASNFDPAQGNFTVKSQSLVGGDGQWVTCDATITVSASPN